MDIREQIDDVVEHIRAAIRGELKAHFSSMPVIVSKAGDGHIMSAKISINGQVTTPDGKTKPIPYPEIGDLPIHFPGGGQVVLTHPVAVGDEGLALFVDRAQDAWHQLGGVQNPLDNRMNALSDGRYIPGGRSDPNKLQNVSPDAAHVRSVDGKVTHEVHPTNGITSKTVDPGDGSSNPFQAAQTYFQTLINGSAGHAIQAMASGVLHQITNDHTLGPQMRANNDQHKIQVHPQNGVMLSSSVAVSISAPAMSLPSQSISPAALAANAASTNVGALGGDLSGTLPNPWVTGILHVAGANGLPVAATDAAAAALVPSVPVGGLYRNGSALMVRVV